MSRVFLDKEILKPAQEDVLVSPVDTVNNQGPRGLPGPTGPAGSGGGGGASATFQMVYDTGAVASDSKIKLDITRKGLVVDSFGAMANNGSNAGWVWLLEDSTGTSPASENPMPLFGWYGGSSGDAGGIRGFHDLSVRHTLRIWGGDQTTPCDAMIAMSDAESDALPAGNFAFRAQKAYTGGGLGATASAGSIILVQGRGGRGAGGIDGSIIMGAPDNENNLTAPYFVLGPGSTHNGVGGATANNPGGGIAIVGKEQPISFQSGDTINSELSIGALYAIPGNLGNTGLSFRHHGQPVLSANESEMVYTSYDGANSAALGIVATTSSSWTGAGQRILQVNNFGVERFVVGPLATQVAQVFGTLGAAAIPQLWVVSTAESATYHGTGIRFDNTTIGGFAWHMINYHDAVGGGTGADDLAITTYNGGSSAGLVIDHLTGALRPYNLTNQGDIGATGSLFKDLYLGGISKRYNNEVTDGIGQPYIPKKGQRVAWSGSATTVLDYTVQTSGFYVVKVGVSCVAGDTVTVNVTYTDANNTTAQTLSIMPALVIGANGVGSAQVNIDANTSTHIIVTLQVASQVATKVNATVTREI